MIRLKKDPDHITTIIFDMDGSPHNVINHHISRTFAPIMRHLQEEKRKGTLNGVILTSAKKSFLTAGDLGYLYEDLNPQQLFDAAEALGHFFRDLERPGVPVVALIAGNALGAGFEVALACHHRIVLDDPKVRVGMPEVNLGIIPSGGSIVRTMWLLGIEQAYHVLTSGRHYAPQEALKVGIIDELAATPEEMMTKARAWLLNNKNQRRPWDTPGEGIPGGTAEHPAMAATIRELGAGLAAATYNNSPAKRAILNILTEGSKLDFETACRKENRLFTKLATSPTAKNMISTFWFDYHAIKGGINRPKGYGKFRAKRIGIIGSGLMGSRIAFACIQYGLSVVLKDVNTAIASRGREYVAQRLEELIAEGTFQAEEREEIMARLQTTDKASDLADCDLIVEAVFENELLKQKVTREAEEHLDEYSVMATNTVSIPITQLAKGVLRPANYVGLHFFHPADVVPLVEIVKGEKTTDETVARAFDFLVSIMKTPIIVKDVWGFYGMRVQNTYILEGVQMLQEGYPATLIENLARQSGMPKGPLELADELGLDLILNYEQQAAKHYGSRYIKHPAVEVLETMLDKLDRRGKVKKAGFYDHPSDAAPSLWPGLSAHFPQQQEGYNRQVLTERLLFSQVIEATWCMQEKVVQSTAAANLGSIFAWGFPRETGGVIRFIHSYGMDAFIDKAAEYRKAYGQRFRLPNIVRDLITEPVVKPQEGTSID